MSVEFAEKGCVRPGSKGVSYQQKPEKQVQVPLQRLQNFLEQNYMVRQQIDQPYKKSRKKIIYKVKVKYYSPKKKQRKISQPEKLRATFSS